MRKYEKCINKLINYKYNKRIKSLNKSHNNKQIEFENINICDLKTKLMNGKKYIKQDEKCEEACFKSFKFYIERNMTKEYFIENNKKRLQRENSLKYKRNKKLLENNNGKIIIWNNLKALKNIKKK